jgi:hypothetical protein
MAALKDKWKALPLRERAYITLVIGMFFLLALPRPFLGFHGNLLLVCGAAISFSLCIRYAYLTKWRKYVKKEGVK